jgi:hypothetical protein
MHNTKETIFNELTFAVYPDSQILDLSENKIVAIFKFRNHAEEFAKSKWGKYYIIKEIK